jgi:hypothetical protein
MSIKDELLDADALLSQAVASLSYPVPTIPAALREIAAAREKFLALAEIADKQDGNSPKNN